jgi:DNA-binding HxlR family transcriptional regulator
MSWLQVVGIVVAAAQGHDGPPVFDLLFKRWTAQILLVLAKRPSRFNELARAVPAARRMVVERLRETPSRRPGRTAHRSRTPIASTYSITTRGQQLIPDLAALWALANSSNSPPRPATDDSTPLTPPTSKGTPPRERRRARQYTTRENDHRLSQHNGLGARRTRGHQRSGPLSLNPPRIGALCGVLAGQELFGGRRAPHPQGARPRQQKCQAYEGPCWSMRTLAPEARPATASWSAVAASASGRVAATWSESSPCARSSTSAASRAPSART